MPNNELTHLGVHLRNLFLGGGERYTSDVFCKDVGSCENVLHELRGGTTLSSFLGRVYDALHGCCSDLRGIMIEGKTLGDDCFPRSTKSKNLLSPLLTSLRRLSRFMHANKARGVHEKIQN